MFFSNRAERKFLASLPPIDEISTVVLNPPLGRNVIAIKNIPAGHLLGVYPGVQLAYQDYLDKHELLENAMRYGYRLSEDTIIDPTDIFGYLPNTPALRLALINEAPTEKRLNIIPIPSRINIWYLVIREIPAGEALYTFYGASYSRDYSNSVAAVTAETEFSTAEISLIRKIGSRHKWLRSGVESLLEVEI